MFSVIIPTMWQANQYLSKMLIKYAACDLVEEVLIINNNAKGDILYCDKIRLLGNGENLFVNPAWQLGADKAKASKIIIANDDVIIDNLDECLQVVKDNLEHGDVIGLDRSCYTQKNGNKRITIQSGARTMGSYFGTYMMMYKADFVPIPKTLKIWGGDNIQYYTRIPKLLTGVCTDVAFSTTVKTLDLAEQRAFEQNEYRKWKTGRI